MRLDQIDPMEGLDFELNWAFREVYALKVKGTDKYFVNFTNTVNFGDLSEAKIFQDKEDLLRTYDMLPTWFKRANTWEILKLQLESL